MLVRVRLVGKFGGVFELDPELGILPQFDEVITVEPVGLTWERVMRAPA